MATASALSSLLPKLPSSFQSFGFLLRFPVCSSSHIARCFLSSHGRDRYLTATSLGLLPANGIYLSAYPSDTPRCRLASVFASLSGGGGVDGVDGGGGGGGGGGGDGGSSSGETEAKPVAGDSEDSTAFGSDAIVLHVGGMSCGGCAASVKRILESLPQVYSAIVNLEKETAFVWAVPEVKVSEDWQQDLGQQLAKHLTTCGFESNIQGN
ncbi:copper-transporting ATPase PAA1, chloroplastic-like [Zingiber officinale]|uniref:copper-transporting ATPase PAA1, chloroplastic-like n=1 Tax=Zingiber officinale TaxID=94328 RepID=UPI001C4B7989|nr:copper-transporting ATPase PAA1, chloroplastic-like [Zingiber officinale]